MGSRDIRQGNRRPTRRAVRQIIEELLDLGYLLQIAGARDGMAWICTVCFARDEEFNLYWFSRHDTRHSIAMSKNSTVVGAVAPSYALGDKSRGLQLTGRAREITSGPELTVGLSAMRTRYEVTPERIEQLHRQITEQSGDFGLYCFAPSEIVLHDNFTYPKSPRQLYMV
jgi:uncharacterized protein YhbP (UPF0306 family)